LSSQRNKAKLLQLMRGLVYLAPSLLLFACFVFYPLLKSMSLSVFNTDLLGQETTYAGVKYYKEMFLAPQFMNSLKATLLFTLYTVVPGLFLALGLAYMANWQLKGIGFFRTIFAFPLSIAVAGASMIFMMFFNPSAGVFAYFLQHLHLPSISWLADPKWALVSVSLVAIWRGLGFNILVLLSGLQSIPKHLYESSSLEGASSFRQFIDITLPLLSPTLFFVFIVSVINAMQAFGEINILTLGGPSESTNVIVYSIYRQGFFDLNYSYASAESIFLFLIILILTLLEFWLLERKVFYR
jgi:sn-glycerol 3-phosphate transport system permease protein